MNTKAPAGWYADPGGSDKLRQWADGRWGDRLLTPEELEAGGFAPPPRGAQPVVPSLGDPSAQGSREFETEAVAVSDGSEEGLDERLVVALQEHAGRTPAELAHLLDASVREITGRLHALAATGEVILRGNLDRAYLPGDPRCPPARPAASSGTLGAVRTRPSTPAPRGRGPATPDGPVEAIEMAIRRGLDFSGRSGRAEYWWFTAASTLALAILQWLPVFVWAVLALGVVFLQTSAAFRRLHDTGRSGTWLWLPVVPGIGTQLLTLIAFNNGAWETGLVVMSLGNLVTAAVGLVLVVFALLPSTPTANRYGYPPEPASPLRGR